MLMFDLSHLPDTSFTFGTSKRDSQLQAAMLRGRGHSGVYRPQPKGKEAEEKKKQKKTDSCKQCVHRQENSSASTNLSHQLTSPCTGSQWPWPEHRTALNSCLGLALKTESSKGQAYQYGSIYLTQTLFYYTNYA